MAGRWVRNASIPLLRLRALKGVPVGRPESSKGVVSGEKTTAFAKLQTVPPDRRDRGKGVKRRTAKV